MTTSAQVQEAFEDLQSTDSAVRKAAIVRLRAMLDDNSLDPNLRWTIMEKLAEIDSMPVSDDDRSNDDESLLEEGEDAEDWLDQLAASKNPEVPADDQPAIPANEDWLNEVSEHHGASDPGGSTEVIPSELANEIIENMRDVNEIPGWLDEMIMDESEVTSMPTEEYMLDYADEDIPSWLQNDTQQVVPTDFGKEASPTLEPEPAFADSEMPDWLKDTSEEEVADSPAPKPAPVAVAPAQAPPTTHTGQVQFSAYHPRVIAPKTWEPFYTYAFDASAAGDVMADAMRALGEKAPNYNASVQSANTAIPSGTAITATPYVPGFQFAPMSMTMLFDEAWSRFDFRIKAKNAGLNQFETGRVTFTVDGIIVADVPISVYVGKTSPAMEVQSTQKDAYQSIFCSYSHADTHIVERVERAYKALGLEYLRDVTALKSGNHWSDELLRLIDRADVFQLFWSKTASESPYVRQEYEYALKYDFVRRNFIRPVIWQSPYPPIPRSLSHIHFAYHPDLSAVSE